MGTSTDDTDVRLACIEARLDTLSAIVSRCCARVGVHTPDFDERMGARMEALETKHDEIRRAMDNLEKKATKVLEGYQQALNTARHSMKRRRKEEGGVDE